MVNSLASATSPYLLQHALNPVAWREWGQEALAEARLRDVPILLSIGYAACHWCHVMAHESFEDPALADHLNGGFVAIKVDREERPDLDAIYQQALALMGQQGGWPLTMFLTPDGEPFWGGTYFPPEPRYGRPSFGEVLTQIAELWRSQRDRVLSNRDQLTAGLGRLAAPERAGDLPVELVLRTGGAIAQQFDAVHGGLGGAPKFPQVPVLDLLWRCAVGGGQDVIARRVIHTLRRLCQGGIYDHLGGGFARYSVDAYWLVPHFEKMLYDNAQILRLLGEAYVATGDPLFAARAAETVDWLTREMLVEDAFASALDADSEGEEGKFYVWSKDTIDRLLGPDAATFELAYGVTGAGNFEGQNVLNRLHEPGLPEPQEEAVLARARQTLLTARAERERPGLDDKVLADWNGLMIAALADAAARFEQPAWLQLAQRAFDWVVARMTRGDRLVHAWRDGRRLEIAFLEDYALMASAAVALFERTGHKAYLDHAEKWLVRVDADYADVDGSFFQTAADAEPLIVRPRSGHDGPSPSGNGALAQVSARLNALTGVDRHRERALGIVRAFSGEARRSPGGYGSILAAALLLHHPLQLVVAGADLLPGGPALLRAAAELPGGALVVQPLGAGQQLPPGHPAAGKVLVDDRPAAYLCVGPVCRPPITEPEALRTALREAARMPNSS